MQPEEIKQVLNYFNVKSFILGGRAATYHYLTKIKIDDSVVTKPENISDYDIYMYYLGLSGDTGTYRTPGVSLPLQVIRRIPAAKHLVNSRNLNLKLTDFNWQKLIEISNTYALVEKGLIDDTPFFQLSNHILASYDINAACVVLRLTAESEVDYSKINQDFTLFRDTKILALTTKQKSWFKIFFQLMNNFKDFTAKEKSALINLVTYLKISLLRIYKYIEKPVLIPKFLDTETQEIFLDFIAITCNNNLLQITGIFDSSTDSNMIFGYNQNMPNKLISYYENPPIETKKL